MPSRIYRCASEVGDELSVWPQDGEDSGNFGFQVNSGNTVCLTTRQVQNLVALLTGASKIAPNEKQLPPWRDVEE